MPEKAFERAGVGAVAQVHIPGAGNARTRARASPLARKLLYFGISRTGAEILLTGRGLLLASLLGPELFGIWAGFRLALGYGILGSLGVNNALEVQVAAARHAGGHDRLASEEEVRAWGRAALGYTLLTFGVLSSAAAVAALVASERWLAIVLSGLAATLLCERVFACAKDYLRASGSVRRFSAFELADAVLQLAFAAGLAALFGLPGAVVGAALATLASIGLIARHVPLRPLFALDRIRTLLRIGLPIGVTAILSTALVTVDRIVVGAFGGATQLGYYAFAVSLSGLTAAAALVIRTAIFPDVYGRARSEGLQPTLRDHLAHTLLPFARLFPPLLGLLALALGPVVTYALPQFEDALAAIRFFVFTGVTAGFAGLGSLGMVAAGQQRWLPLLWAGAFACNLVLSISALQLGLGLEGVAAGALLSRCVSSAGVVLLLAAAMGLQARGRILANMLFPLAWCAVAVSVIGHLLPQGDPRSLLASLLLYVLALAPLMPGIIAELRTLRRALAARDQPRAPAAL